MALEIIIFISSDFNWLAQLNSSNYCWKVSWRFLEDESFFTVLLSEWKTLKILIWKEKSKNYFLLDETLSNNILLLSHFILIIIVTQSMLFKFELISHKLPTLRVIKIASDCNRWNFTIYSHYSHQVARSASHVIEYSYIVTQFSPEQYFCIVVKNKLQFIVNRKWGFLRSFSTALHWARTFEMPSRRI